MGISDKGRRSSTRISQPSVRKMVDAEPRRLLVRGFPRWLKAVEKESLLKHFGATEVITMPTRGKMRNCAFATFASHEDTKRALGRLHQLCVLQSRLVVEYVQDKHTPLLQDTLQDGNKVDGRGSSEDASPSPKPVVSKPPPPTPRLSYRYPPPSPSTLTNITHTLASIPKFYIQVLHLMNLMNLPPPFGPLTPAPPLMGGLGSGEGEEEEEGGSEVESEVGSGNEGQGPRQERTRREVKRRTAHVRPSKGLSPIAKRRRSSSEPQFELVPPLQVAKRIALHVPSKIEPQSSDHWTVVPVAAAPTALPELPVVAAGSGQSRVISGREEEERGTVGAPGVGGERGIMETGEGGERKFISSEELAQSRLSRQEMKEMSIFRGYSAGEPSLRLYIKNLARHTTEEDLYYVYGRYIDWTSDREKNVFDVRLMQAGRMKGQAFVGLPSEEAAAMALRETNGYQLAGRPMVVHFARTAKAKPGPTLSGQH